MFFLENGGSHMVVVVATGLFQHKNFSTKILIEGLVENIFFSLFFSFFDAKE